MKEWKKKKNGINILAITGCIGIILGVIFVAIDSAERKDQKVNNLNNNLKNNNLIANTNSVIFNESPLIPLKNGWYKKHYPRKGVAPIKIKTKNKDVYYFIKIVDAYSDKLIKEIFVHGGESMNTLLPLGNYKIKYAIGEIWYGKEFLFGPKTSYNLADDIFNFYETNDGYMGYTIELFLQVNGNLETKKISKEDF